MPESEAGSVESRSKWPDPSDETDLIKTSNLQARTSEEEEDVCRLLFFPLFFLLLFFLPIFSSPFCLFVIFLFCMEGGGGLFFCYCPVTKCGVALLLFQLPCLGNHNDNVRCTAAEEQPEAKEAQLSQPSSTSLLMISPGTLYSAGGCVAYAVVWYSLRLPPPPELSVPARNLFGENSALNKFNQLKQASK